MIQLNEIKNLLLERPSQPNRPLHLSAASGLVKVGPWLYVVADDELHIGKFSLTKDTGELYKCFPGELPLEAEERKAAKPDVEVLALLPNFTANGFNSLLALGSGSKRNRRGAALIGLDGNGDISSEAKLIDLSLFYEFLKKEIGKLNIEGAAILKDSVVLFQRGNKKNKLNASIRIRLDDFYRVLREPLTYYEPRIQITPYDLGETDQVPFCFTDATALLNGDIIFTASAENTSDSYLDGMCMGSLIGIINHQGSLSFLEQVDKIVKLEGIAVDKIDEAIEVLVVTDADDITHPAKLYSAQINI